MKNIILKLSAIILALSFAACDSNKEAATEGAVEATQEVTAEQPASENAPAQEAASQEQPAATQE